MEDLLKAVEHALHEWEESDNELDDGLFDAMLNLQAAYEKVGIKPL